MKVGLVDELAEASAAVDDIRPRMRRVTHVLDDVGRVGAGSAAQLLCHRLPESVVQRPEVSLVAEDDLELVVRCHAPPLPRLSVPAVLAMHPVVLPDNGKEVVVSTAPPFQEVADGRRSVDQAAGEEPPGLLLRKLL